MQLTYEELNCIACALQEYQKKYPELAAAVNELSDKIVKEQGAQSTSDED